MHRGALIVAVLAVAVVAAVFVSGDERGNDAQRQTTGERRPAPRTPAEITQPAQRIPCPSHLMSAGRPRSSSFDARQLLGATVRAAEQTAKRAGCALRVVRRDGEDLIRTDDSRSDRINVEVEGELVVRIADVS